MGGSRAATRRRNYRGCERALSCAPAVTSIPRRSSVRFNSAIAASAVAELLAFSMRRSIAFKAGSLSLMTHRRAKTWASCRVAICTVRVAPGSPASKPLAAAAVINHRSLGNEHAAGDRLIQSPRGDDHRNLWRFSTLLLSQKRCAEWLRTVRHMTIGLYSAARSACASRPERTRRPGMAPVCSPRSKTGVPATIVIS